MLIKAGPLSVQYENGFLRYISHGDREIIRMIYFALRDENWNTYEPHFRNEVHNIGSDHFTIEYDCFNETDGKDVFRWHARIEGNANGVVTFELQGEALQNIKKNRAGFCILHPIKGVSGNPVEIHHPDKTVEVKTFPLLVSPENPFKQVRKLRWKMDNDEFELSMSGEVFETEDQRNWTDASYKTFCTPHDLPYPVQLKSGDQVYQKVVFRSIKPLTALAKSADHTIHLSLTGQRIKLPAIGIGASTEVRELGKSTIGQIRALGFDHYRVDVWPAHDHWVSTLSHDCSQAFDLGLHLEAVLHLTSNFQEELDSFILLSLQNRIRIKSVILLSEGKPATDNGLIAYAIKVRKQLPNVKWGAGTDYNFTELNRNRFDARGLDFVTYSIHPQAHATDDTTLIENLEGQFYTANTAGQIFGGFEVHVSPITLKKRYNASATDPSKRIVSSELRADPRQKTDFACVWTLGSLKALARAGVSSVTYYQTAGNQGILAGNGDPFPLYDLFERILPFRNREMMVLESSRPLEVDALLFEGERTSILWLVNYSARSQSVKIADNTFSLAAFEVKTEKLNRS